MCPRCHRHLVEIDVHLGDIAVTMHACSTCDTRWWDCDGLALDLGRVLDMATAQS